MKTSDTPIWRIREMLDYDPETGLMHWKIRVCHSVAVGAQVKTINRDGYVKMLIKGVSILAHRVAWAHYYGEHPNGAIDHINGIRTDNRIANLRIATNRQNQHNRGYQPTVTGYKGIARHPSGKCAAQIKLANRTLYLGMFDRAEDAALAYDRAATYFYGEYAATNFKLGRFDHAA